MAAGRLTDQKNFGMLIDAFREISKKHSDYKLYIYGEGPLRNELDDRIKKVNHND